MRISDWSSDVCSSDLSADTETIAATLQPSEFRRLFEKGREGHEGFYAFQNQMSERTPEFDEIIFNFRSIGRAFDRLVDTGGIHDEATYDQFVRLNALVRSIEHNGEEIGRAQVGTQV